MGKWVMALDQGTTSSRCILFDEKGRIAASAQKEFTQYYPNPGWVEHDPMEIWSGQLSVAVEALGKAGGDITQVAAIGITNQRETTIVWNRHTGKPVYPAIVWQCRRTAGRIKEMKEEGWETYVKETTGLIPDAYFSGSKCAWILENVPGTRELADNGDLLFGTVDTWLIWNLTAGKVHVTDYTNASRTMLFDIHKKQWDHKLLDYFNIPVSMMPEVKPSGTVFGETANTLIGAGIPIAGAAGDQQAALFGQGCIHPGEIKNTYGTGCFLLMNTGKDPILSSNGLLTTIAAGTTDDVDYCLEGSVFVAGAAVQWLRDECRMIEKASDTQTISEGLSDTDGVYVVPAFTGLGAPYWNPYARGMILGLTRGSGRKVIIRATLESLAYQTGDVIHAMERDAKKELKHLKVDGGASNNDFLMQFQADILKTTVIRPSCVESTALGAAFLAGLSSGYWRSKEEVFGLLEEEKLFVPAMSAEVREEKLKGWARAVSCALAYTDEEEVQDR